MLKHAGGPACGRQARFYFTRRKAKNTFRKGGGKHGRIRFPPKKVRPTSTPGRSSARKKKKRKKIGGCNPRTPPCLAFFVAFLSRAFLLLWSLTSLHNAFQPPSGSLSSGDPSPPSPGGSSRGSPPRSSGLTALLRPVSLKFAERSQQCRAPWAKASQRLRRAGVHLACLGKCASASFEAAIVPTVQ